MSISLSKKLLLETTSQAQSELSCGIHKIIFLFFNLLFKLWVVSVDLPIVHVILTLTDSVQQECSLFFSSLDVFFLPTLHAFLYSNVGAVGLTLLGWPSSRFS